MLHLEIFFTFSALQERESLFALQPTGFVVYVLPEEVSDVHGFHALTDGKFLNAIGETFFPPEIAVSKASKIPWEQRKIPVSIAL